MNADINAAIATAIAGVATAKRQRDDAKAHFLARCRDGTLHESDTATWQRAERALDEAITGLCIAFDEVTTKEGQNAER